MLFSTYIFQASKSKVNNRAQAIFDALLKQND